jgi:hypothetical protein
MAGHPETAVPFALSHLCQVPSDLQAIGFLKPTNRVGGSIRPTSSSQPL